VAADDLGRLPELERLLALPAAPLPEQLARQVSELAEQVSALRSAEIVAELGEEIERFGRYRSLKLLGRGGMGAVYRAHDPRLQRAVAIKFIRPGRLGTERACERFVQEARATAKLDHPGIVKVYDVGESEGTLFLVMDCVNGRPLSELLPDQSLRATVAQVAQLARALHHAHERGIVHRDVKPANVLIDEAGRPRLVDFGVARDLNRDERLTMGGEVLGTCLYMAPEQVRGAGPGAVSPAVDTYALGCTLYQALCGHTPFESASKAEVMARILNEEATPPSAINPDTPPPLEAVVLKCLEGDSARRYASSAALAEDLEAFLAGRAVSASYVAKSGREPRSERLRRRREGRAERSPPLAALAGGAAAILLLGLFLASRSPSKPPPPQRAGGEPAGVAPSVSETPRVTEAADGRAPEFVISEPAQDTVVGPGDLIVRGRVRDASTVEVRSGESRQTVRGEGEFELCLKLSGESGSRELEFVASDRAQNQTRATLRVVLDATPPVLEISAPTEGAIVGARVSITARLVEEHPRELRLGDQELVVGAQGSVRATQQLSEGPHTLKLTARDAAGNETTVTRGVLCDLTPPHLELQSPSDSLSTHAAEVEISGMARDAHGPPSVRVSSRSAPLELSSEGRFSVRIPLEPGETQIEVSAIDLAGNRATLNRRVMRSTSGPAITLSPELPPVHYGARRSVVLRGLLDRSECSVSVKGKPARVEGLEFERRVKLTVGDNEIEVVATDRFGNSSQVKTRIRYERRRPKLPPGTWWAPPRSQLAYAKRSKRPLWFENSLGMRFVLVPPGSFNMGSPGSAPRRGSDEDLHPVSLSEGFYIGATEVTNEQFRRFDSEHATWDFKGHTAGGARQPVGNVTWDKARAFCAWLSKRDRGLRRYRLPTEAEWEYACRAGTQSDYFWGKAKGDAHRFCNALEPVTAKEFGRTGDTVFPRDDGFRMAAPVGSLKHNPWGLFDVLGNMSEHVSDWYQDHLSGPARDPQGPASGADHVIRGGAWNDYDPACRSSSRAPAQSVAKGSWGFRVVVVEPATRQPKKRSR
jgi:serine/threonine protein kinase/formylglycine-generating enzyme required for sulfatase activity